MRKVVGLRFCAFSATVATSALAPAMEILVVPDAGMDATALAAINRAADRWEKLFFDPIRIRIEVNFTNLGQGVAAQASPDLFATSYANMKTALTNDRLSPADFTAVANLQGGNAFSVLLNRTSNNPNGNGSATPYLDSDGDANNTTVVFTRANGRALGLLAAMDNNRDSRIVFGTGLPWDFDPSNGIGANDFDFEAVAAHEIGHAMGFTSGVDIVESFSPDGAGNFHPDNEFDWVNVLDLYRFSTRAGDTRMDFTMDGVTKFFSINGGATNLGPFSHGARYGAGQGDFQASHWENRSFPGQTALGIMDPQITNGELGTISALDTTAFDVIGYNAVPEPATMLALGAGALALLGRRRRKL